MTRRNIGTAQRLAIAVCCVLQVALAADAPAAHVRNFGKVNNHLYRGGEPSLVGLQELAAMGVRVDIDLRESGEGTNVEQQAAKKLGMRYINIPFPPLSAPQNSLVERVMALLTGSNTDTVFVHCRRGKDRTGTVIACYRIQHDGWDHERALTEAKRYGISFAERGMRSYILHFTPIPPATAITPIQ
jgi:protein tyrosine/serine phosphatase